MLHLIVNQYVVLSRERFAEELENTGDRLIDLGTDQTDLTNAFHGGYIPAQVGSVACHFVNGRCHPQQSMPFLPALLGKASTVYRLSRD